MTDSTHRIDLTNLLLRMAGLTRRWRQVLDVEFQDAGLTDATWRPLLHLYLMGDGVRQKDLAASLGLEGPSLVRLIDTLLSKGLILRVEDEQDRRAKLISLTEEGRRLVEEIRKAMIPLESGLLASFDEAELARLADYVKRLESAVNDARKKATG